MRLAKCFIKFPSSHAANNGIRTATAVLLFILLVLGGCRTAYKSEKHLPERVILLHGLGRSEHAMFYLQKRINSAGFSTQSISYRSMKDNPDTIIDSVGEEVMRCCHNKGDTVHFVGHSLGGLVVRAYLEKYPLQNIGHVVLLGTPNQGSELVDKYGESWLFGLLGPTARQLGTGQADFPKRIAHPYYPLGIIAGSSSILPMTSRVLPGPDDGMVAVESTKVEGMTDYILVDTNHSMLIYNETVADEVIHFLRKGEFSHASSLSSP
jgi:pimeloyl-ACP methyl ester carboxylesterase